jgi:hypothetical protein
MDEESINFFNNTFNDECNEELKDVDKYYNMTTLSINTSKIGTPPNATVYSVDGTDVVVILFNSEFVMNNKDTITAFNLRMVFGKSGKNCGNVCSIINFMEKLGYAGKIIKQFIIHYYIHTDDTQVNMFIDENLSFIHYNLRTIYKGILASCSLYIADTIKYKMYSLLRMALDNPRCSTDYLLEWAIAYDDNHAIEIIVELNCPKRDRYGFTNMAAKNSTIFTLIKHKFTWKMSAVQAAVQYNTYNNTVKLLERFQNVDYDVVLNTAIMYDKHDILQYATNNIFNKEMLYKYKIIACKYKKFVATTVINDRLYSLTSTPLTKVFDGDLQSPMTEFSRLFHAEKGKKRPHDVLN